MQVIGQLTGDRDPARPGYVSVLAMAPTSGDLLPAVGFDELDDGTDLHEPGRLRAVPARAIGKAALDAHLGHPGADFSALSRRCPSRMVQRQVHGVDRGRPWTYWDRRRALRSRARCGARRLVELPEFLDGLRVVFDGESAGPGQPAGTLIVRPASRSANRSAAIRPSSATGCARSSHGSTEVLL